RDHGLGDQLARHRADDVHAENVVVLAVRDDLRETRRLLQRLRAPVDRERKGADLVPAPALLHLLLGQADPRDLGGRVDHGWYRPVIDLRSVPRDQLGDHHAFLGALVREHRTADDVADGPDVAGRRPAAVIDLHEAALVELDAGVRPEQTFRVRPAADTHDQLVDLELLALAAALVAHLDAFGRDLRARDLGAEPHVETLPLEVL